jgi:hypothetical protein
VDLTISRPIRIFALVAVIAAIGGLALLMMKPKSNPAPVVVSHDATAAPAKIIPQLPSESASRSSHAKPPVITSTKPATSHARQAPAKTATAPKRKAEPVLVAANGLPMAIAKALRAHAIVVVSVFDPQSRTDSISYAEARAGASAARAGFVGISLLDSIAAGALTTAQPMGGLLPSPGVLVYRRPGVLVYRIDGFADRDAVAQAAVASITASPLGGS